MTPSPDPSSSRANPPDSSTFTMIGERDLEAIGAHCHAPYCNMLDFLPFRCESCKYLYCLDHRTETAHSCPKAGTWAANRNRAAANATTTTGSTTVPSAQKPTLATGTQCSHPQCKTYINTHTSVGVHCGTCRREYCLKHRLAEDHSCATLTPLGVPKPSAASATAAQKAASAFSRLRAWGKDRARTTAAAATSLPSSSSSSKPKSSSSSAAARTSAINALKTSAKGDTKIPTEKRVYVNVEAEAASTTAKVPKAPMFFSAEWKVGRVLDEAARALQVENLNNRGGGEEERLRVYHIEGGRLLEFSDKFGGMGAGSAAAGAGTGAGKGAGGLRAAMASSALVKPEDGVRSGDTIVLLRGVGPAVPDLIET